ncbi:unnamed protein product [Lasius platythorax]|uniref:Uncharacterized protein n=1 Tax=Lasius platythorax TaxID=488582 RepID=A0AAV2NVT4_9HYME
MNLTNFEKNQGDEAISARYEFSSGIFFEIGQHPDPTTSNGVGICSRVCQTTQKLPATIECHVARLWLVPWWRTGAGYRSHNRRHAWPLDPARFHSRNRDVDGGT